MEFLTGLRHLHALRGAISTTRVFLPIELIHANFDCIIQSEDIRHNTHHFYIWIFWAICILFVICDPRIPRMTVVPNFEKNLVCSSEFEIMQPCSDIGPYAICFLLKTSYVYKQIENLTSGTSSSHSRIKREQLAAIRVPYPVSNEAKLKIQAIDKQIATAFEKKYEADSILRKQLEELESLL